MSALATGATLAEAATAPGVSKRRAIRWHAEPGVQAELAELQRATLEHARKLLLGLVDAAADTLRSVMADADSPASRVSAARTVLAQVLRFDERTDLQERLQRVEQAIEARRRFEAIRR